VTATAAPRTSTTADRPRRHPFAQGALAGVVSGGLTLGVAELVGALVSPESTPVIAVGRAFIERTPPWLKDFAVARFGTNDKLVLLIGMTVVVALLSVAAGVVATQRFRLGLALVLGLDAVAVLASVTRPDAGRLAALPTVAGALAGAVAFGLLLTAIRRETASAATSAADATTGTPASAGPVSRRHLLTGMVGTAAAAAATGTGGRLLEGRSQGLDPAAARLPAPIQPGPQLPPGATVDIPGITPFVTPNRDFYRIDTALLVPRIDASTWRLRLHGMVDRELVLSYADLLGLGLVERTITLTCVSNEVGGTLAGNATWLGYPLADLLARVGVHPDADMLLSASGDGFTVSTPLSALTDGRDALLAVGMNGAPLPAEHGFPARMVVPGLYGYVSATKWVVDLEVTRFDRASAYWTQRGYAAQAPIRTFSRIDVPKSFARLAAGPVAVAGMAWAQHRGIGSVQVRVDGGPWQAARIGGGAGAQAALTDMWRQWVWTWDATPGTHLLEVRAADGAGAVQPQQRRRPAPDGATGWHSVSVSVT